MGVNLWPIFYAGEYRLICELFVLLDKLADGLDELLAELGQVLLSVHWK